MRNVLPPQPEAESLVTAGIAPDSGAEVRLTPEAAGAWSALRSAAAAEGVTLWALSGFRSVARQAEIIAAKRAAGLSDEEIFSVIAPAGHSEHHTGRALDIGCPESHELDSSFAETAAFAWLQKNAGRFGFRLSYPPENRFGIRYEPWHWCYHPRMA